MTIWLYDVNPKDEEGYSYAYVVELRDLEFLRSAAGQDRELVQREFVLIIAAGDEAVHRNHVQNVPACRGNLHSIRCGRSGKGIPPFLVRPSFRWKFAEGGLEFRPE